MIRGRIIVGKNKLLLYVLMAVLSSSISVSAQAITDYLILQDIGAYKLDKPEKNLPGEPPSGGPRNYDGPGALAGSEHFRDHTDKTYEVMYLGGDSLPSPTVKVTQHINADSDKWLVHEVDADFRSYYGFPAETYGPRTIDGQTVLEDSVGGAYYRWVSGDKIVAIRYSDAQLSKPEPLEIIRAYLAKHPSTLKPMKLSQLRSAESKTTWIKTEMDRRLWLCDKWFMQLQMQKVEEKLVHEEVFKNMKVFLKYRERYYGIKSDDEENLIYTYFLQNSGTAIKTKLLEYKNWWGVNKTKPISLGTVGGQTQDIRN